MPHADKAANTVNRNGLLVHPVNGDPFNVIHTKELDIRNSPQYHQQHQ